MTQTQLVRSLAETCEVNNKTARAFLDGMAAMAIAEVKKNGVFRTSGNRPPGESGPQGAHGTQPRGLAIHQDSGQEGREVPRGKSREGCDRSAEEEVTGPSGPVQPASGRQPPKKENPARPEQTAGFFWVLVFPEAELEQPTCGRFSKPSPTSSLLPSSSLLRAFSLLPSRLS